MTLKDRAFHSGRSEKSTISDLLVIIAAFAIMAISGGARLSFGVFFKPVMNELGWTRAMTSGAFSLSLITHGLVSLELGRLTDKFGPRVVLTICGVCMGAGYLLMSQLSTLWQLYLFYGVIVGIGAAVHVPILSTVARRFSARRGLLTGIVMAGVGLGQLILPSASDWLISTFDWRLSCTILGVIALLIMVVSAQFMGYPPVEEKTPPALLHKKITQSRSRQISGLAFRDIIHLKEFHIFLIMYFFMAFCSQSITVHIAPYVTDLGISSTIAAGVLSFMGGAVVLGRLFLGNAADKIGEDKIFLAAFLVLLIDLTALLFIGNTWAFYLFAIIFGFTSSAAIVASTLIARIYGLKAHAMLFSIANLSFTLGGAVGPYIFGYFYDIAGSYQPAFQTDIAVAFLGLVFSIILVRNLARLRTT